MIVPAYWAEARVQQRAGDRQVTVRRFGWSDAGQDDAQAMADARAAEAMRRIVAGEPLPKREPKMPYNGAAGVPIREEITGRHGSVVVTRNSYGARCLNVPDVLFAFALTGEDKSQVIDNLPHQWGLFEVLAPDEAVYVADLVRVDGVDGLTHLLLIRRSRDGEDPEAARAAFKDTVRAAGFRAPKLEPLDARRREVALAKRRGVDVAALLDQQRRE